MSTRDDLDPLLAESIRRVGEVCLALPETREEDAWVGVRWRVRQHTFARLGHPWFKPPRWPTVAGLHLGPDTDWDEVGELLTDSYSLRAPRKLTAQVPRPPG